MLSLLILAGSVLTLLKRQRIISRLDLGVFTQDSPYKYSYDYEDLAVEAEVDSSSEKAEYEPSAEKKGEQELVDINSAGFFDLQALPGVGPAIADRIIAYRDSAGEFESIEELMMVKGIGPAKFEKLREKVIIR